MAEEEFPLDATVLRGTLDEMLEEATADPERRAAFQLMLLNTDLFAATPDARMAVETLVLQPGDTLKLRNVMLAGGEQVPAIFTSEARLTQFFGAEVGFVTMKGRPLFEMVADQGAALNPGFPYGVHWTPAQLAAMLGRPARRAVGENMAVGLGTPAEPPAALIAALQDGLDADARIEQAWLALAHWPETDELAWYLDLRSASGRDELGATIARALTGVDLAGKPLDVVVHPLGGTPGTGIRIKPR